MKKIAVFSFLMLLAATVSAQKVVNDPNAEARVVPTFHAIHISGDFDVLISQGTEEGLAVSAERREDVSSINTEVKNGVLHISFDHKGVWRRNSDLKAYISVKHIDEIKASGATDVNIEGSLSASRLSLELTGASDLEGRISVKDQLNLQLTGASDMTLSGTAGKAVINISGANDLKAMDLVTANCSIKVSGASDVKITVEDEISADISGASSVTYKGGAKATEIKTSGAGNFSRKS